MAAGINFRHDSRTLPKVDKGSLGRVYEALGGVLMSSTFLSFLLTISVGVV